MIKLLLEMEMKPIDYLKEAPTLEQILIQFRYIRHFRKFLL